MKIFISHSSKDQEFANALSNLLESFSLSVNVFCSSQIGSIKIGQNFVKSITAALDNCDAFIPLLSENYYNSKFCMIELGFAYSVLVARYPEEYSYIFPIAISPIKREEALSGTPLAQLQVASIDNANDMKLCVESVFKKDKLAAYSGVNSKISEFVHYIKSHAAIKCDIVSKSKQLICKSSNVPGEDGDYLSYSFMPDKKGHVINFRAKPFSNSVIYPDFLSFVYQYIDKLDLYESTLLFENVSLKARINNYTNSINKLNVEIKHSDSNLILHRQTFSLREGENTIIIPLSEIKCTALRCVSEICFVLVPSAYMEDEGMFQVYGLELIHN